MKKNRDDRAEQEIDRKMNKTALITLWVDPAEHQIVKYTFDNVWLDFLPGAWLVRVDDLRASMTMGQPFDGIWLPRTINIYGGFMLATGPCSRPATRRAFQRITVRPTSRPRSRSRNWRPRQGARVPRCQRARVPECQRVPGCQGARVRGHQQGARLRM